MANARRTQKEIEKDYAKIKEAAKSATSWKDIAIATGLSILQIKTSLSKHPIVFKRVREQLEINKNNVEQAILKQKELAAKEALAVNPKEPEIKEESKVSTDIRDYFVLDASMTRVPTLENIISNICTLNSKIVLTSITVVELKKLQYTTGGNRSKAASYILSLAVNQPENFSFILINDRIGSHDDCILQYCMKNKDSITLLTADREMYFKSKKQGIIVSDFSHSIAFDNQESRKISTLLRAKKVGEKLVISDLQTASQSIRIYSYGIEYNEGNVELNIGDDVFIATNKLDYISFTHFSVISLDEVNNCELLYARRIYEDTNITKMNAAYKSFIKDVWNRFH